MVTKGTKIGDTQVKLTRKLVLGIASVAVVAIIVLVMTLLLAPSSAHAAETLDSDANVVNTHQVPDSSFIYDTDISSLANANSYYDGQTVQITGEAIGDAVRDGFTGTHYWVTVATLEDGKDDTVSVYMSESAAKSIDMFGDHAHTGTILQISGTYHLVCTEHQGVSDVHATSVSVVKAGVAATSETFNLQAFLPGLAATGVGVLLTLVYLILRRKSK